MSVVRVVSLVIRYFNVCYKRSFPEQQQPQNILQTFEFDEVLYSFGIRTYTNAWMQFLLCRAAKRNLREWNLSEQLSLEKGCKTIVIHVHSNDLGTSSFYYSVVITSAILIFSMNPIVGSIL